MDAKQEAERLRKEFGNKAVKVVDFILKEVYIFKINNDIDENATMEYWKEVKSELQKIEKCK